MGASKDCLLQPKLYRLFSSTRSRENSKNFARCKMTKSTCMPAGPRCTTTATSAIFGRSSFVDILRRYLKQHYKLRHVINITRRG